MSVRVAASPHAETALIVDALRRAHLIDEVPWSQMAVIVRSVRQSGAALSRALTAAGVPVVTPPPGVPLAEQPAARAMLTVLAAVADGLDGDRALDLLTGPIGRVDPVSLRQLRRALRRADRSQPPRDFGDLLVDALESETAGLSGHLARPLRRVRAVLAAARRSEADGADPRYTLWQAWHRSGLQRRWLAASERGGTVGAKADADLDAVTALFDVTEQYVSRTAGASLRGLVEHVSTLGPLPAAGDPPADIDGVTVLSAHAALGREWDVVVIAGLQEGLWPNTTPRGGVLGTQLLVDVLDGVTGGNAATGRVQPGTAAGRGAQAADRRHGPRPQPAAGDRGRQRQRRRLDVALAVPLRTRRSWRPTPKPTPPSPCSPRGCSLPRRWSAACARWSARPRMPSVTRYGPVPPRNWHGWLRQGFPAPTRRQWYGMTPPSTDDPLWSGDDHVVRLSPSTLQTLADCPLRWLLERHGGTDGRDVRSAIGSLVHALVADKGKTEGQMAAELERLWEKLPFESAWYADNELARHRSMLSAFAQWRAQTRHELTEVGTEVDVDGVLESGDGQPAVRVRGRLDRLERDGAGRLVVVDIKTGKTPVSKDDAQRHAQLAMYQLAIAEGLLPQGDSPGGGRLVYLGRTGAAGPTEREQDALTPDARGDWRELVRNAAAATQGPQFLARINDGCAHCPVRQSCPAQAVGRRNGAVVTPTYSPAELASALGLFAPTDEQAAVIAAPPGPLVVIAGAGAGKTETMAARVVWLVANGYASPGEVLGLTFTRKAAGQLLRRVRTRLARLAGTGIVRRRAGRGRRPGDGEHLPRVRRHAAARARPAAADRARHPAAQRNGVVAVGISRRHRASRAH